MKRFRIIILIVLLTITGLLGLIYWHQTEMEARARYKVRTLCLLDSVEKKQVEMGWTEEETLEYNNRLCDSLGITYPSKCPYCFVELLMK